MQSQQRQKQQQNEKVMINVYIVTIATLCKLGENLIQFRSVQLACLATDLSVLSVCDRETVILDIFVVSVRKRCLSASANPCECR